MAAMSLRLALKDGCTASLHFSEGISMEQMDGRGRQLMWWGMALFMLGLLTGLVQNSLANPRMGLSAHLEGLMNGTFLIAFGSIWRYVRLAPRWLSVTYASALYGALANWCVTLLAAILGTSSMTPLAGKGFNGAAWQEILVTVGFVTVGIAMLLMAALAMRGLRAAALKGQPG